MIRGLYTSASGMTTQIKKQDTIANNIANINTNGFKKSETIMTQGKEFDLYRKEDKKNEFIKEISPESKLSKIGKLGTGVKLSENFVSHSQGLLKKTDEPLDFAIEGKGFFAFHTDNGIRYSRSGNLSLNQEGYVVNSNGDFLLANNFQGDLAYVKVHGNFEILANGEIKGADLDVNAENLEKLNGIVVNLTEVNQMKNSILISEFDDVSKLNIEGDSYFYYDNQDEIVLSDKNKIYQGFLEGSNVNIVKEMVEMINVSRLYETNQKVLTSQDEVVAKTDEISKWT